MGVVDWLKRRREAKKYRQVHQLVSRLLSFEGVLIRRAGKLRLEDEFRHLNGPALGYVYGFVDAALRIAGLELTSQNGRLCLLSLLEFFTQGRGEWHFDYIVNHTTFPEIHDAIEGGRCSYLSWVDSKGKALPWGWGKYFGMGKHSHPSA